MPSLHALPNLGCMHILKRTGLVLLAAILLALPAAAGAQTDGRFTGVVIDATGAFVPGATVTIKNEKTGEERTVKSNDQGVYVVANLKPSVYTIRVTFGNFAPIEITGLNLTAAQEFPLDLTLQPAGLTETVTVQGTFSTVDVSSARMGVNVTEREVLNLPVNGRQMSQLLLQAPGSQNAGTGTWQDIRFSGRAVEQNVIRYDGIEGSAIIDSAPGNVNGENNTPFKLQASLENVQEFRVESNNYPAEYGTGTGGQISVVTKSGANAFHGAMFEYFRSDKLDASNYFDKQRNTDGSVIADLGKSPLKQNQFGGSIRRPDRQGSRLLLRQLRGLPPRRWLELHRGRAERGGVGDGRPGDCGLAVQVPGTWRGHPGRSVKGSPVGHRAVAGDSERPGRLLQRAARPEAHPELVELRARVPRQRHQ